MSDKPRITHHSNSNTASSLGINEEIITSLVHNFYAKVRNDPLIGPIFEEKIGDTWDEHLETICDFWSNIALATGRYRGQPLLKHIGLPALQQEHFIRWLKLFAENAYNVCPTKDIAEFFIDKAKKIADSLMRGIAFHCREEIL